MSQSTDLPCAGPLPSRDLPEFAPNWALFLDVDGTLVELAETPGQVVVNGALRILLDRLRDRLAGTVVLLSGRSLEQLDRLFHPSRFAAGGLHGSQSRCVDGRFHQHAVQPAVLAHLRTRLQGFADRHDGTFLEDKGATLALHYRLRPEVEDEVMAMTADLAPVLDPELRLQHGKYVLEVTNAQHTKGTALQDFMGKAAFRNRLPVMLGDDVTDESAFTVAKNLGGLSFKVGPGESVADYRLGGPAEVRAWLNAYLTFLQGISR